MRGEKFFHTGLTLAVVVLTAVGCSTQKNTAQSRWWNSFNARYNTYFNGSQAFIDGNLEKERGNRDNYTELIPLYPVGNQASRDIGKDQYDRTIEKCEKAIRRYSIKTKPQWNSNKQKTARDREWLGRGEYNPFIWKAWLLLGKAQFQQGAFDEAAATFSYMSRLYHTQPLQNGLARAWLAKCYTELGWMYDAEDVIRNMSRDSMDFRAVKDWDYTYANYYIRHQEYEKAIPYLHKVIRHERRRTQRARAWFLMGQLQHLMNRRDLAYKAFGKAIGCHPPYELEFNARIAQTEVMAGTQNARSMIGRLKRMAASDNNAEYQDQVYYAIGNILLAQKDTLQAIAAYETGSRRSARNGIEKGVLLLTLGNLYWGREQLGDARRCYGEAIGLLDKERPDYAELARRSKVLDELVPYTDAVHLQDSLLALASMPEAGRLEAIDRVISALYRKEKEEQEVLLASESNQEPVDNAIGEGLPNQPQSPAIAQQGNGQWYFYNPMAVSQGKAVFLRQWGRRANTDNWRRANQTVVALAGDVWHEESSVADSLQAVGEDDGQPAVAASAGLAPAAADDPHRREYYLTQIPFSEEQKATSARIIKEGLFHAGVIFKDQLDNLRLSEQCLVRLTRDYQDDDQLDDAWYHLFLLYSRQGRRGEAENCLNRLKKDFPASEWTILLTDPYYTENARFGEHIEDSLYAATYEAFRNGRSDMVQANTGLSASRFPQGANRARFLLIDGLSRLNEGDGDGCIDQLRMIVERYPASEVSELAGMIVKGVQEGRRLHGGRFELGDVWSKRDITLSADSTVADTLSAGRNENFLFLLVYQPDSVHENQLLFELARYNFTNFLVRNFDIRLLPVAGTPFGEAAGEGWRQLIVSGFLNFDEALQYARQLYADKNMPGRLAHCRSLVVSETNMELLGTRFDYEDYLRFYEDTFLPLKVSDERLLIVPESLEQHDIEDASEADDGEADGQEPSPADSTPRVEDFDFGDDFW